MSSIITPLAVSQYTGCCLTEAVRMSKYRCHTSTWLEPSACSTWHPHRHNRPGSRQEVQLSARLVPAAPRCPPMRVGVEKIYIYIFYYIDKITYYLLDACVRGCRRLPAGWCCLTTMCPPRPATCMCRAAASTRLFLPTAGLGAAAPGVPPLIILVRQLHHMRHRNGRGGQGQQCRYERAVFDT